MTDAILRQSSPPSLRAGSQALAWPLAALALMVALQLDIATNRAINWDEFWHYSQVRAFAAGGWMEPLQTLHARAFAWAVTLPGDTIDHLIAMRWVVFCFLVVGAIGIYAIAERFAERSVALICTLLYLSAGFVLQHGTSFRADGIVVGLLMAALAVLVRARLNLAAILIVGALCALAAMVTIKVVLYAPAFLGLAWLRWSEARFSKGVLVRLAAVPLVALAAFGLLYLAHSSSLGTVEATGAAASGVVERSGRKMFAIGGLPYYTFILKAALMALVFAACVLAAPFAIAKARHSSAERIALAGFWLPITVVGFYHNTAPYFYVFILAPVAVACAPVVARLIARYSIPALVAILTVGGLAVWAIEDRQAQDKQRRLISGVEAIFGEPVAYFDFPAMLGGWPKANHFMTPWGQDAYLSGQAPSFLAIMRDRPVPLLIANAPLFEQLYATRTPTPDFLPADARALRENYVSLWGPFRIAGREVVAGAGQRTSEFLVPGPYTVHDGPVIIDGKVHQPGNVITLARGPHTLASAGPRDARLIWGDRVRLPTAPAPAEPYWADF